MKKKLISQLNAERKEQIFSIGKKRNIGANKYFISAQETPKKFAFIISGLFRYVYINKQGQEITKGIIPESNFISSYTAMVNQSASYFFIEALEDSQIIEIHYSKWVVLKNTDPFWDKFLVSILEQAFATKEKRERDLLLLDAETRYLNFLHDFPNLQDRLKVNQIASYLGIHPESLSRIRNKLEK